MNLLNKITSLILIICVLTASLVFAESDSTLLNEDGKDTYDFLMAIGAMDPLEKPYNSEEKVTRARFVKMALHLSNDAPNVLISDDEVFSDVNSSTEYETYIETAFRLNYISGSFGTLFNPTDIITLPQALKILVNILGYAHIAEYSGGYPSGYYTVAQNLKLTNGLGTNDDPDITMSEAMTLLYNAANADLMEKKSFGDDIAYEAKEGRTLLTQRHKIEHIDGIINANSYTGLYAQDSKLAKNQIKLDDKVFNISSSEISDLLGLNVTLWYKNDTNVQIKEAVYVKSSEDNMLISASCDDLEAGIDYVTIYNGDSTSKTYRLKAGVTYIVNKKMQAMMASDLLDFSVKDIKFISNDGDKIIDVVVVSKYDNLVVSGVDSVSNIITAKDGSVYEFDPENEDHTFELLKNNKKISVKDVSKGDSIAVSSSNGNGLNHTKVLVSSKKISGVFTEIGQDYAVIDGTSYSTKPIFTTNISLGKNYTVLINAFDEICHIENSNDMVYGFLYAIGKEGLESAKCRIFTENNRWVDLKFADKVKFSDSVTYNESRIASDDVYTLLSSLGENLRQMIRYNVNESGEIITMELSSSDYTLGSGKSAEGAEKDIFRLSYTGSLNYRSINTFDGKFFIDSNTIIFSIPTDYDMSKFSIKSTGFFVNDQQYTVTAYDVDNMLSCKLLVASIVDRETLYNTDRFMIVSGKGMKLNSDKEAAYSIIGYRNGKEISFPVDISENGVSQNVYNNIKSGNLIIPKFDENGNICYISSYDITNKYLLTPSLWNRCTIMAGEVKNTDISLKRVCVSYSELGDEAGFVYTDATTVQIWNKSTETLILGTVSSILPGDTIYAKMRNLSCNEIIVIRE